ncbi:MAG TPA: hypothetical protein VGL11_17305 [Candidatus Binatia bacterium]|jgi:hypothetical protein
MNTADLTRARNRALAIGVAAAALCLIGALVNPQQFFRSYLVAYLFWIGLPLGCFALVMLHHLVGGRWGFVTQRLLESAVRTFPLMAALFVPLVFGMRDLYPWSLPGAAADPLLQEKSAYLNPRFFGARAAVYFAVWIFFGRLLYRWSVAQDRTGEPSWTDRLQNLSGPGLVLYGLTVTFSAIDWIMSLEPHWYSTIYGMMFMVSHGLAALAFVVVVTYLLAEQPPLSQVAGPDRFHDLGNLLLAFVMLWAYLGFSQFLLVWVENLREEIPWYLSRITGGWQALAVLLIVFQFALPFLLLLSRAAKRRARLLSGIALLILFMHWIDLVWLAAPAFHPGSFYLHWIDFAALAAIGGIWIAAFLFYLGQHALLPLHDPRFVEAIEQAQEARQTG